jgi:anaerobic selenocysteine-containing dehydrogenase
VPLDLMHGTNPVYSAPDFLQFAANLQKVAFKAAWVTELDETAMQCDLVLPLLSPLEDFGTHVASNQFDGTEISIQQPLMEKLYPETRSFGDVVLDLLRKPSRTATRRFPITTPILKSAVIAAKPAFASRRADEEFWENTLSAGVLHRAAPLQPLARNELTRRDDRAAGARGEDPAYPFT